MSSRIARAAGVVVLAGVAAFGLAGCVEAPAPMPSPTAAPSSGPSEPAAPELDLSGSAADNLAYFDQVNLELIETGGALDGRAFIDALATAGFPKSDMEVTPDQTAINLAADNVQFSVRMNGTCLLGQYGNIGYRSAVVDLLSTGRCLVGATRPIDW